jgi:small subunit ribosomal protein S17
MTKETVQENKKQKTLTGVVVSDKMTDTVVVEVSRYVKHAKYGKFLTLKKKIKAHDAGNTKKIGETVTIAEVAPISKDKSFKIV